MSKTTFSKKCEILGSVWFFYRDQAAKQPAWSEFFTWADIALPLSYFVWLGIATVKKGQESYVNDAWNAMCEMISVDPDKKYDSHEDLFAASPNPPVES